MMDGEPENITYIRVLATDTEVIQKQERREREAKKESCTGKAPLKRVFNPYIKAVLLFSLQHLCRLHLSFSKLTVQKEKTSYSDNLPFIYSNINNIPSPLMPCPNPHQVLRQSPQHDSQAPSTGRYSEKYLSFPVIACHP